MPSRRRVLLCSGVLLIGLALLGSWWVSGRGSASISAGHSAAVSTTLPVATSAAPHAAASSQTGSGPSVPAETLIATIRPAGAAGSQTPGGPFTLQVPGQWWGAASELPVIAQQPGWVEVRLAQRPNGSLAWVPSADLSLATDPYYIVVDLGAMHLQLFKHGQEVASLPAGIGVPSAPTPTGQFFVALFARAPTPAYGAFVIVTSGHSNAISDWEESGDAITAIHGPLGSDASIGTSGARVSNGCIRLHDADLDQLRAVPAGTPIHIVG